MHNFLLFFKFHCHHIDTRRRLYKNSDIVTLRQFRENRAWTQQGQEKLLINMKGLTNFHNISYPNLSVSLVTHRICTFSWNISQNTETVIQAVNKNAAYLDPRSATISLVNMCCFSLLMCSLTPYEVAVLPHVNESLSIFSILKHTIELQT